MAKQYEVTITLTFDEDLEEKTLSSDDLPGLGKEQMPADEAILHAISGFAWDACDDAGLKIKDWDYNIKPINQRSQCVSNITTSS